MSNYCKYYRQQKYMSIDGGVTWTPLEEYQKGRLIERNSDECGYVDPIYRTITSEPYCSGETGYDKYVNELSQVSYNNGASWITTATTPILIEQWSQDCGYVPMTKWERITPTSDPNTYMCESCGDIPITQYRWVTISGEYLCSGTTKMSKEKKQESNDGGVTWIDIVPSETRAALPVIDYYSADCGDIPPTQYRWVVVGGDYLCSGTTKMTKEKKQQSTDGGETWVDIVPSETRAVLPVLENESLDCGATLKFLARYSNASAYSAACHEGDAVLATGTTRPRGRQYTAMTSATIGECITSIGEEAFRYCYSLRSVVFPSGLTSIGKNAFYDCRSLRSVTIPDSVTSIDTYGFGNCSGLTSVTIGSGVTTFGNYVFISCSGLTSVILPDNITSLGEGVFWGCGGLTNVNIPSGITSIPRHTFYQCNSLTSITIPSNITSIGESSFGYCRSLRSVTIPETVTSIGKSSFDECSGLTTINLPSGLTNINSSLFRYCTSLSSITIPESVTSIDSYSFYYCSGLTSLDIPSAVTTIGDDAFFNCKGLTAVTVNRDIPPTLGSNVFDGYDENYYNQVLSGITFYVPCHSVDAYKTANGWSRYANQIQQMSGPCVFNGKWLASYSGGNISSAACSSSSAITRGEITAKNLINVQLGDCVTSLEEYAFYQCYNLTSITMSNNITSIGKYGLSSCSSLSGITLPNSLTSIGQYAFYTSSSLSSITIPDSVTSIGDYAFYSCNGMKDAIIGSGMTSIPSYLFYRCLSLSSVTIPDTVTSIGQNAFDDCDALINVTIPNDVTTIGKDAFSSCDSLRSATIGSGVTSIGRNAFHYCRSLSSITIPDSVTSLGDYAFYCCSGLRDAVIGNGVTTLERYVFTSGSSLTSVTIGSGITSIGQSTFKDCTSLSTMIIYATTPPSLGSDALLHTPIKNGSGTIYVPCDSVQAYQTASNWSAVAARIQPMPYCGQAKLTATYNDSTTFSAECDGNTSLTTATTRPSGYVYSGMTSAVIGDCITSIGEDTFNYCISLTSVTIPSGVTSIDTQAFRLCYSLPSIDIPDSVTSIGYNAFGRCYSLSSITIPDSVTSIDDMVFASCSGITSCTIGSGVTSIGINAFGDCSSLQSVTINATTPPSLGYFAFDGSSCPIYVPCESVNAYKSAWSDYASRIQGIPPCYEPQYRTLTTATTCVGFDKYTLEEYQVSTDNGVTWRTTGTSATTLIEANSTDCGYVPPTKWIARYSGGTTTSAACDATGEIVEGEIARNKLIGLEIESCVTRIGDKMLFNYINFDGSITIPDSVTSIGNSVFFNCKKLRTVTIGSGVTSMGNDVFFACDNLSTVTINAVVPPTLGTEAFDNTTCRIKVPSGSVNAYKSATNWSAYASRITSI